MGLRADRYLAALAPGFLVGSYWLLSEPHRRRWLQQACLLMLALFFYLSAWAELDPNFESDTRILSYLVRAIIVTGVAVFAFGFVIPRWRQRFTGWWTTLLEAALAASVMALVLFALLSAVELILLNMRTSVDWQIPESIAVVVMMLVSKAGFVSLAIRPQRDPLAFLEKGRQLYVYAAKLVAIFLLVHIYTTLPQLFENLKQFWPYVAMAVVFAGVAVAQILKKRKLDVLAAPLFNSATVVLYWLR